MDKLRQLYDNFRPKLSSLWLIFFCYTALVSFFIQFIVLPLFFSRWHAGGGLLGSCYDCIMYHNMAVELSQRINQFGWHVWELRPSNHAPAGIAAALYFLFGPKLWVLIPLNAAVHATSAILLLSIINTLLLDRKKSFFCVLPFLMFPTAALWYAQILKDGYFILGAYFCLFGLTKLGRIRSIMGSLKSLLQSFICIITGLFIIWVVRKEIVMLIAAILAVIMLAVFIRIFLIALKRRHKIIKYACFFTCILIILTFNKTFMTYSRLLNLKYRESSEAILETVVNSPFEKIAIGRKGFLDTEGNSNIDNYYFFNSPIHLIRYIPRATQLVFFAPFPKDWLGQGSEPANTFLRRVTGLEMIIVYLSVIFLPLALYRWKRRADVWIFFFFCGSMLLFYGLIVCNIGTLYRLRYGFLMALVTLGIAQASNVFSRLDLRKVKDVWNRGISRLSAPK